MSDSSSDEDFLGATSLKLLRRFTTTTTDDIPGRAGRQQGAAAGAPRGRSSQRCDGIAATSPLRPLTAALRWARPNNPRMLPPDS
jgi:hypothetical protein